MCQPYSALQASVTAFAVVHGLCCHVQEPEVAEEQHSGADAAVTVSSETAAPASKAEAAEKPISKAPARNTRIAAPAAKIRLGSKYVLRLLPLRP